MMSVIIECREDAVALAATLTTLVPGAVEGLVREVLVVDRGMDVATRKVADHAGCRIVVATEAMEAAATAKGEWLLLVEPGARLAAGWIESVADHAAAAGSGGEADAARFSSPSGGWRAALEWWPSRRHAPLRYGLLVPKTRYGAPGLAARSAVRRLSAVIRPRDENR